MSLDRLKCSMLMDAYMALLDALITLEVIDGDSEFLDHVTDGRLHICHALRALEAATGQTERGKNL